MKEAILPCFWRAPTDNDKGGGDSSYFSRWKAAQLDNVEFLVESCSVKSITDKFVEIEFVYLGSSASGSSKSDALFKVNVTYLIYGSGDIITNWSVEPNSDLPPLPRVGIEFHIEKTLDRVEWYGKGPFECYPDRKAAAHVAIYEHNVGDMHVPYIVPGESGGRTDVRWVTFRNKDGVGIYASTYGSSSPMQMNASYYTTSELHRATHEEDLIKGQNIEVVIFFLILNLLILLTSLYLNSRMEATDQAPEHSICIRLAHLNGDYCAGASGPQTHGPWGR